MRVSTAESRSVDIFTPYQKPLSLRTLKRDGLLAESPVFLEFSNTPENAGECSKPATVFGGVSSSRTLRANRMDTDALLHRARSAYAKLPSGD